MVFENKMMSDYINISNALTLFRILISPYIAFLMINNRYKEAVMWAFIGGMSDMLDGAIARKLNQTSDFGTAFDPIADKIFAFVLFMTCVYLNWIPIWFFFLTIAREILIIGGLLFLTHKIGHIDLKPLLSSKINTGLQFLLIGGLVLRNIFPIHPLCQILLVATTITTIYSGFEYLYTGFLLLKNGKV